MSSVAHVSKDGIPNLVWVKMGWFRDLELPGYLKIT